MSHFQDEDELAAGELEEVLALLAADDGAGLGGAEAINLVVFRASIACLGMARIAIC